MNFRAGSANDLESKGIKITEADVTSEESCSAAFCSIQAAKEPIDLLICNAGR